MSYGTFSFNRVSFVKSIHDADKVLFESTFQQSSTRPKCNTSRSIKVDLNTSNVFCWNKNVFLQLIKLKSKFNVMTMDEVILNTTESAPDFCVICWVRRLRFSRILLQFSNGFCDWGLLSCRGLHTWLGGLVRRILNVARIRIRRTCDSSWRSSLTKTWTFVASTIDFDCFKCKFWVPYCTFQFLFCK